MIDASKSFWYHKLMNGWLIYINPEKYHCWVWLPTVVISFGKRNYNIVFHFLKYRADILIVQWRKRKIIK